MHLFLARLLLIVLAAGVVAAQQERTRRTCHIGRVEVQQAPVIDARLDDL